MATKQEPAWVATADRISIGAVTVGALIAAVGILVAFVVSLVTQLGSTEVTFPVLIEAAAPAGLLGAERGVVSATVDHMQVTATDLSSGVFAIFIAADAVRAATGLVVALSLALMGWRLLKGDPFRASVIRAAIVSACALIISPFVVLLLTTTATLRALMEIAGPTGDQDPGLIFGAELDLTPVLVGFGLAVVLGVFEFGQRLKADTEGLV